MLFLCWFSNPPQIAFGANLAPTWCQNALKKWPQERPGKHQKPTSSKKQPNSRNINIYYTLAMSATPQRHPFRALKSYKIDKKTILKHKPLKNDKQYVKVTFFSDFGSQLSPLGGSTKSLFRPFFNFGPSWDQNASQVSPKPPQNHPRPPFLTILGRCLTDVPFS